MDTFSTIDYRLSGFNDFPTFTTFGYRLSGAWVAPIPARFGRKNRRKIAGKVREWYFLGISAFLGRFRVGDMGK